jgi:hypothetical protein
VEEHLYRALVQHAFGDRALEFERVDLEVFAARSRMAFRIDLMILVREVLELDRLIGEQCVASWAAQVAAGFFVARVGGDARLLDDCQHALGDLHSALNPRSIRHVLSFCFGPHQR